MHNMKALIKDKNFLTISLQGIFASCISLFLFCFLGCVSNYKKTEQRFYLLESRLNQKEKGVDITTSRHIVISDIRLPNYLDRPQIVSILKKNQLTFSESARWGESLKKDIVRVVRKNLMADFPHSNIEVVPHYQRGKDSLYISIEITSFAFDQGLGKVTLEAIWSLEKDNQSRKTYTDSISLPLGKSKDTERVVSKMSDCLGKLSDKIAMTIEEF